jgi:Type IV secretion system pilin
MHAFTLLSSLGDLIVAAPAPKSPKSIPEVIDGLKVWIMGILAAVATLFLVIGGLRYMSAGGDPAQMEQAKGNFKSALAGYALAVLAPVILAALQGILGG